MTDFIIVLPGAALGLSLLVTWLTVKAGVLDEPGARSSHSQPTPRAGGLGIAAGVGAALVVAGLMNAPASGLWPILGIALVMAALGFADDLVTLPTRAKFAGFVVLCLTLSALIGPVRFLGVTSDIAIELPYVLGWIGCALFAFVVINAVNFMDGSDGMLVSVMAPASVGLVFAGLVSGTGASTFVGLGLAGALLGFGVFNRPKAKVFAGDVGSLLTGTLYAGGALAMAGQGFVGSLWLAPLFVLVFLVDVLLTLARRARHGRFSLQAHREHAYQRLIQSGWSHGRVALAYGGLTSLVVASGVVAAQGPEGAVALVFAAWTLALTGLYAFVVKRTS